MSPEMVSRFSAREIPTVVEPYVLEMVRIRQRGMEASVEPTDSGPSPACSERSGVDWSFPARNSE